MWHTISVFSFVHVTYCESKLLILQVKTTQLNLILYEEIYCGCSNYSSLEEFLKHGIGYAIVHNGEIISAASSYTYCNGNIEITIGTQNEFRRNGLALAVASKLILDCMEQNIYPRCDAANLGSVALAEKLGYHLDKEYQAYSIS